MAKVLRIFLAAGLFVVVAAGCGGAAEPRRSAFHGVPPSLAQEWEGQARAIATAAAAGNDCHALQLANSLRTDVIARERKLPLRLRSPLRVGVDNLANRIECAPVVQPKTPKPPKGPKPKPLPKPEDKGPGKGHDRGHDRGHDK
jgi:hypothetical protein